MQRFNRSVYRSLIVLGLVSASAVGTLGAQGGGQPPARRPQAQRTPATAPDSTVRRGGMEGVRGPIGARPQYGIINGEQPMGRGGRGQMRFGPPGRFAPGYMAPGQYGPGMRGQMRPGPEARGGMEGWFAPGRGVRGQMRPGARAGFVAGVRAGQIQQRQRAQFARRAAVADRIRNLTPEQRDAIRLHRTAARDEARRLNEEVKAGKLTEREARHKWLDWRLDHRLNIRPDSAQRGRGGRRGPGGPASEGLGGGF